MAISPGEASGLRAEMARAAFIHTLTRTPITAGPEDSEGNATRVAGAPTIGLPCRYRAEETLRTDEGGRVTVYRPNLSIPYDSPLAIGDLVSAIVTQPPNSVVLLAGPLMVERIEPNAAFGPTLAQRAYLAAGDVRL